MIGITKQTAYYKNLSNQLNGNIKWMKAVKNGRKLNKARLIIYFGWDLIDMFGTKPPSEKEIVNTQLQLIESINNQLIQKYLNS